MQVVWEGGSVAARFSIPMRGNESTLERAMDTAVFDPHEG